jgi:hypothetical protein
MHIHLGFDQSKLQRYAQSRSPLVFEVAWEHNEVFYPAPNWSDFGVVILTWWLRAAVDLFEGAESSEFLFMDGPSRPRSRKRERGDPVQRSCEAPPLPPAGEILR